MSHATGLNFAYERIRGKYDVVGFLDHDCFPVKGFDIVSELGNFDFLSITQDKKQKYPHPGYLFVRTFKGYGETLETFNRKQGFQIRFGFAIVR